MSVVIEAMDKASAPLNRITGGFNMMSKQGLMAGAMFAGVTMGMQVAMQAGQQFIQWLSESGKKFREFEYAMAEVNIMLGEHGDMLPELSDKIIDLSVQYGVSAMDMSRAMYQILSAGMAASDAIAFLGQATKLAKVGFTDAETAVDALTTVINAYGYEADAVTEISDIFQQTVILGKVRMEELANALGYVVPIASSAGIAFEEVATAMAVLSKQGINATKGATGLRQVINNFIAPTEAAAQAASEFGITLSAAHFRAVGFAGIIEEINEKTDSSAYSISQFIPNVRALSTMLALVSNDGALWIDTSGQMYDANGIVEESFKSLTNTMKMVNDQMVAMNDKIDMVIGKSTGEWDASQKKFVAGLKASAMGIDVVNGETDRLGQTMASTLGVFGLVISAVNDMRKVDEELARVMAEAEWDTTAEGASKVFGEFVELIKTDEELQVSIGRTVEAINDLNAEIAKMIEIKNINDDIYAAGISLKNLGIEVSYSNQEFKNIVETLNNYEMALDGMKSASDNYSLAQQENRLAMMQMDLIAKEENRELTEEELANKAKLELSNDKLAVNSLRNNINMSKFKRDHYNEAKAQYADEVARMNHRLHVIKDNSQQEIFDKQDTLRKMYDDETQYQSDRQLVWKKSKEKFAEVQGQMVAIQLAADEAMRAGDQEKYNELIAKIPEFKPLTFQDIAFAPKEDDGFERWLTAKTGRDSGTTTNNNNVTIIVDQPTITNAEDIDTLTNQLGSVFESEAFTGITSKYKVG